MTNCAKASRAIMSHYHDDEDGYRIRGRKPRSKKQKDRRSAGALIRRLAWMDGLLVFWTGEIPGHWAAKSTRARIARALKGKARGLYLVDRADASGATFVTPELLTQAEGWMGTCGRGVWVDLAKRLGDPNTWFAKRRARLRDIGKVLRAAKAHETDAAEPSCLLIEEQCLWIGSDVARPSVRLLTEDPGLVRLRECVKRSRPGCRAAAILLARHQRSVDTDPQWPLDLLCHASIPRGPYPDGHGGLPEGLQEYLLTCEQPDVGAFLRAAPRVQSALNTFYDEPQRRFGLLRKVVEEVATFLAKPYTLERELTWRTVNWAEGFWGLVHNRITERFAPQQALSATYKLSPAAGVDLLLGLKLPQKPEKHLPRQPVEIFDGEAALGDWLESLADKLPARSHIDEATPRCFIIFARMAAMLGPDAAADLCVDWFQICRERVRPSGLGTSGMRFACHVLERVGTPEEAAALRLLGPAIFKNDMCWIRKDLETVWGQSDGYLPYLVALMERPEDEQRWAMAGDRPYYFRGVWQHCPDRFAETLHWCHRHLSSSDALIGDWTRIFCQLRPRSRRLLADWFAELVEGGMIRKEASQVCQLARQIWYASDRPRGPGDRIRWFEQNPGLFRAIWREAVSSGDKKRALRRGEALFQIVNLSWSWQVFGEPADLVARLVPHITNAMDEDMFNVGTRDMDTAVALSCGDLDRLVFLLRQGQFFWDGLERRKAFWRLFDLGGGRLIRVLSEFGCEKTRLPRIAKFLDNTSYLERIGGREALRRVITSWQSLPDSGEADELAAMRERAGLDPEHPGLANLRAKPAAMRKELEALTERDAAPERRAKLAARLADREGLAAWIAKDTIKLLAKHLPLARFEALSADVEAELARQGIPRIPSADEKDWENAQLFPTSVTHNRRIMKKLLRSLAAGDRHFVRKHPANQRFLQRVSTKGNMSGWLKPTAITVEVGDETWTAYTETDPLKVLQMGNLFGTCLSRTEFNAHSAVANAVEINKRVLYVKDGTGNIIGRKLIVLSNLGEILPFTSYGAGGIEWQGQKPWVKIALDLLCLKIARRSEFGLVADPERYEDDEESMTQKHLQVFARWYFDCCETYDWWVLHLLKVPGYKEDPALARRELLDRIERRLAAGKKEPYEHGRLLLWLGHSGNGITVPSETRELLEKNQRSR